jgi:hypothetical protein
VRCLIVDYLIEKLKARLQKTQTTETWKRFPGPTNVQ